MNSSKGKNKISVLWIDDEHVNKGLAAGIFHFKRESIIIDSACNTEEAILKLENNILKYDAILIDGFFNIDDTKDEITSGEVSGLNTIIPYLKHNQDKYGKIPFFIYTGQTKKDLDSMKYLFKDFEPVGFYYKGSDESSSQLIEAIKNIDSVELNIKIKYKSFFEILSKRNFKKETQYRFLLFLKFYYDITNTIKIEENYIVELRKIAEEILSIYNINKVLPDDCYYSPGRVNFNYAMIFLRGKELTLNNGVVLKSIVPPLLNTFNNMYYVYNEGNSEAHLQKEKKRDFDEFEVNNLISITTSAIELIFEMNKFLKEYVDKDNNYVGWETKTNQNETKDLSEEVKNNIEELVELKTVICQDSKGNYFCEANGERLLLLYGKVNGKYDIGVEIIILKTDKNQNKNSLYRYKEIVVSFEII